MDVWLFLIIERNLSAVYRCHRERVNGIKKNVNTIIRRQLLLGWSLAYIPKCVD